MIKTRKSMYTAGFALLVCIALLMGTTFAWFTDSISNKGNKIQAGNMDITATYQDVDMSNSSGSIGYIIPGFDKVDGEKIIFSDVTNDLEGETNPIIDEKLWEPGKSSAKLMTVNNNGSLAAKIKLDFNVTDGGLKDALWFDFVQVKDGKVTGTFMERPMSQIETYVEHIELPLSANENVQFILLYGMKEEAGNEYQSDTFNADVTILATQLNSEKDGFGNPDYDENAMYDNGDGTYTYEGDTYVKAKGEFIQVTPSETVTGLYEDAEGGNYVSEDTAIKHVFNNASEGEEITLITDVEFSASTENEKIFLEEDNATVDLNGKALTVGRGDRGTSFGVVGDGSVVKNGTFKCGDGRSDYPLWITGNEGRNHVTVENVTIEGGMQVTGTVSATLRNVKITANNYYVVYLAQDSKVTVESGEFTGAANKPHFYIENYSS